MACITEAASGFPNANGHIPFECASIAEVLNDRGWNTYAVGKWHLTAEDEMNLASSKRQWPLGRGFERFYGFLGGETNQWYPDLVYDNHPVPQPASPEEGYHLTVDLTDKAIEFVQDAKAIAPDKPFFLYFCPGAAHAPHHSPREWADKYKGKFDMGYEAYREQVFANQKQLGIVPTTPSSHRSTRMRSRRATMENPGRSSTGCARGTRSPTTRSGCLHGWRRSTPASSATPTTRSAGCSTSSRRAASSTTRSSSWSRTMAPLARVGRTDRSTRTTSSMACPDTIEENLKLLDELGGPKTNNHYPTGWAWAFNTPFKMWKRYASYEGGTADPLIVSWPNGIRRRRSCAVSTRTRSTSFRRCSSASGSSCPRSSTATCRSRSKGSASSTASTTQNAPTQKETQFYSMLGTRAIWHKGWKAATAVPAAPESWGDFHQQRWELFDTESDPSECNDLAQKHPEKLQELIALWWAEAGKYGALPLESRSAIEILGAERPQLSQPRAQYAYYPGGAALPESVAPNIRNRSYTIAAELEIDTPEASGVLFSQGSRFGGHALYLRGGKLKYVYNWLGDPRPNRRSRRTDPNGPRLPLRLLRPREHGTAGPGHPQPVHP